jgi:hypothetical protein
MANPLNGRLDMWFIMKLRLASIALLCHGLMACKHQHVLMPTPNLYVDAAQNPFANVVPEYRSSAVEMLYATDREAVTTKQSGHGYGWDRSPSVAFGLCTVQIGEPGLSWEDLVRNSRKIDR